MTKPKVHSYTSVWESISDTPEEAANLRLRSELMDKITALIQKNGWTQLEAAKHCSVTQPRISASGCMWSWKQPERHQNGYFCQFSGIF